MKQEEMMVWGEYVYIECGNKLTSMKAIMLGVQ